MVVYPSIPDHVFDNLTPEQVVGHSLPLGVIRPHVGDNLPDGYVFCHGQKVVRENHDFKQNEIQVPDLRSFPLRFPKSLDEPNPELMEVFPSPLGTDTGFHWIMKVRHVER